MAFCREYLRRPSRGWSQWIQALGDWIQQVEMKASEGPWSAPFEYPLFVDLVIWFQPLAAQRWKQQRRGVFSHRSRRGRHVRSRAVGIEKGPRTSPCTVVRHRLLAEVGPGASEGPVHPRLARDVERW